MIKTNTMYEISHDGFPEEIGGRTGSALGLPDENGNVVLLSPTKEVPVGGRMF